MYKPAFFKCALWVAALALLSAPAEAQYSKRALKNHRAAVSKSLRKGTTIVSLDTLYRAGVAYCVYREGRGANNFNATVYALNTTSQMIFIDAQQVESHWVFKFEPINRQIAVPAQVGRAKYLYITEWDMMTPNGLNLPNVNRFLDKYANGMIPANIRSKEQEQKLDRQEQRQKDNINNNNDPNVPDYRRAPGTDSIKQNHDDGGTGSLYNVNDRPGNTNNTNIRGGGTAAQQGFVDPQNPGGAPQNHLNNSANGEHLNTNQQPPRTSRPNTSNNGNKVNTPPMNTADPNRNTINNNSGYRKSVDYEPADRGLRPDGGNNSNTNTPPNGGQPNNVPINDGTGGNMGTNPKPDLKRRLVADENPVALMAQDTPKVKSTSAVERNRNAEVRLKGKAIYQDGKIIGNYATRKENTKWGMKSVVYVYNPDGTLAARVVPSAGGKQNIVVTTTDDNKEHIYKAEAHGRHTVHYIEWLITNLYL